MEDIIVVKPGIEPQIYYRHICTQCDTELEIKNTHIGFKCPCCNSDEICIHDGSTMIKKFIRTAQTPIHIEKKSTSKKALKK